MADSMQMMQGEDDVRTQVKPYLRVRDAAAALDFYKKAFGARELLRLTEPEGRIGHAEIAIGDAAIYVSDEYPEHRAVGPHSLGGSSVGIALQVANVDRFVELAVSAGATVLTPVADQFYGDRSGTIEDPFGHVWHISTRHEDVTPEEMQRRFNEQFRMGDVAEHGRQQ